MLQEFEIMKNDSNLSLALTDADVVAPDNPPFCDVKLRRTGDASDETDSPPMSLPPPIGPPIGPPSVKAINSH